MLADLEVVVSWGTVLRRIPRPCVILMGKGPVSVLTFIGGDGELCVLYGVMTAQELRVRYRFCSVCEPPVATVWRAVGLYIWRVGVEL